MSDIGVSLVIPFYNEADSLKELYGQVSSVLGSLSLDYEIIFVNDGSTDSSPSILKELSESDSHIKAVTFRKNQGKAKALMVGFQQAESSIVITLDADLQDDPKEIPRFIEKVQEGFDCVSGWKKQRRDSLSKRAASKIFNFFLSLITGIKLHDFNCGFKAYRKEALDSIVIYGQLHRYIPVFIHWAGFKVGEIEVVHHRRKFGKSKYGPARYFSFFDLLTILLLHKFIEKPLYLFGTIGFVLFLGGFLLNIALIIWKYTFGLVLSESRGLLALILGVFLILVGLHFIAVGLLGELIVRLLKERRR